LPEAPAAVVFGIEVVSVYSEDIVHCLRERTILLRSADKVEVVSHERVGENGQQILSCAFVQRMQKHEPVGIVEKHVGTTISPVRHMTRKTWNDYPTKSRHKNLL
jgi:hypothetical protein